MPAPARRRLILARRDRLAPPVGGWTIALDARRGVGIEAGAVTTWLDPVTNRAATQATPANRPTIGAINDRTALLGDGTNDHLATASVSTLRTCVVVAQRSSAAAPAANLRVAGQQRDGNNRWLIQVTTGNIWQAFVVSGGVATAVTGPIAATTAPVVLSLTIRDATVVFRVNGVEYTAALGGGVPDTTAGLALLADAAGSVTPWLGLIGAVAAYPAALSAADVVAIEAFYGHAWEISQYQPLALAAFGALIAVWDAGSLAAAALPDGVALGSSSWPDGSGNGRTGTFAGSPVYRATGINGLPAIELVATSSQHIRADAVGAALAGTATPFTALASFRKPALTANQRIWSAGLIGSGVPFHDLVLGANIQTARRNDASATGYRSSPGSPPTAACLVTVTYSGSAGVARLNGVEVVNDAQPGGAMSSAQFAIGAGVVSAGVSNFLSGFIASLAIYAGALSGDDLAGAEAALAARSGIPL
jgi:hypothetical protein